MEASTQTPKVVGSRPADFPGTPDEASANRGTHDFDPEFGRCTGCDCRPYGRVALWPCGADVPRVPLLEGESLFGSAGPEVGF